MQNQKAPQSHVPGYAKPRIVLPEPFRSWAGSVSRYPRHLSVPRVFEEVASEFPDGIALSFRNEHLTYSELNTRANRLARQLKDSGAGLNVHVALCMERSIEMIVGILAILKAGGAYVPIEPSLPAERILFILHDTEARLILTQSRLATTVLYGQPLPLITLDETTGVLAHKGTNLEPQSSSRDLAYVMYTSGSTGKPKGVMIEHRSIVRLVRNTNYCDFSPDEAFLQAAPISFDASTFEIWGALLNGARLVLLPPEVSSLEDLGSTILANDVTSLWLTSGLFHLMVEQRLSDLRNVKQLLTGGDVVSSVRAREVLQSLPHCTLINGYGPTENTTFTCCHRMEAGDLIDDSVPIGRPIANTQVFLLDSDRNPVGEGAVGEVYVAGEGLARGYLNDPELTTSRFVENPFARGPGERMYRTGDLASWRPDGTLEFIGRIDDQVKILGHRVEPAEVEAALRTCPAVLQAHVVAESSPAGSKRLIAYFVTAPQIAGTAAELRSFLSKKLPPYMIPASFVHLRSLPLNTNGKVDRDALREAPTVVSSRPRFEVISSDTYKLESAIRSIWTEVLETEHIPGDANFFDLGGNSLLLVSMHSKLELALHRRIPIVELFQFTTIEKLAKHLAGKPIRPQTAYSAHLGDDSLPGGACETSCGAGGSR